MNKTLRALLERKTRAVADAKALTEKDGGMTAEDQAKFDALKSDIDDINRQIKSQEFLIEQERQAPPAAGPDSRPVPHITVDENILKDPKHGFKTFGEYASKVQMTGMSRGRQVDTRLEIAAAAAITSANEATGADGGFAIPPEFSKEIWRMSLDEGALIPFTSNTEVEGNAMTFPKDETTAWGGTGVQVYWQSEANAVTATKPKLGLMSLRLHKMMCLVPVTDELINDGFALGSYLTPLVTERIMWKANEAILFGSGAGQPLGCLNSPAAIVVAKETGQATLTLSQPNISKMRARLKAGEFKQAVWIGNPDILPALEALTVGQLPIFLPPGTGIREAGYDGLLVGRPLLLSEHANAFSSQGDLNLVALQGYRTITKANGIETATSMHLYFDADQTAFRVTFRMDGQPIISAPIQPPTGKTSNTRSYFTSLGAR